MEPQSRERGRVGRYRILGTLGQGGMGCLYLARSEGPGGFERLAALKMIHEHLSREPAFVEMFLEEARIAARIHHPNVVTVYEIGQHDARYFIAMDYIHGETLQLTLSRSWKQGGSFPLDIAAHIIASTAEGLHQAHELVDQSGKPLGVVHRDVSPGNVMIGYDGTVRVMDFGVAKAADSICRTQPGFAKGKAPYMSPEQIADAGIDRRADVFALGVVLWEATVGKRLFKASNDAATIARIMSSQVPLPSTMRAEYPPELERIVLKALMPRREDRYPTARALAQDLRGFLERVPGRLSAIEVEAFMQRTFPDRHASRVSMLHQATALDPPTAMHLKHEEAPSVSIVPSDVGRRSFLHHLNALIEEELEDSGLEATAVAEVRPEPLVTFTDDLEKEAALAAPIGGLRFSPRRASALASALVVAGIALGVVMHHPDGVRPAAQLERAVIPPATAPSPAAPELERVVISFAVTPPSAEIEVDGRPHEGSLVVDRSDRTYRVRVSAAGHEPIIVDVAGDRSQRIEIALQAIVDPRPARKRPTRGAAKLDERAKKPIDGLVGDGEL
jgi:eukaryotic-like serine/threonine-protein kinase